MASTETPTSPNTACPHSRAASYQDQNRDLDRNRKDDVLLYDTHRLSGNADRIHDLGRFIIHDNHIRQPQRLRQNRYRPWQCLHPRGPEPEHH